ncbi:unnamed protein product [Clonostachys byssicola]|uniref:Uncharacterized protein n=1 Tax=Clonostachys byssicola TaxID=160290 RepID=A0A9N9Y751_9HYPO|nr:unnamed protein product [Clonostachys byssicola]
MSIAGPRFNCKELGPKEGLIDPKACQSNRLTHNEVVYRAENRIREDTRNDPMINSFKLSWYPEPFKLKCDPQELKTLDCSMTLAQYKLQIDSSSQSRSINVIIEDDKDVWPEKGIPTSFPEAFSANESPRDPEVLAAKFPLAQAYAISRAAILALAGDANLTAAEAGKQDDTYAQKYYSGSATGVFGSPYIGLNNTNEPNIIITADRIQRFLQDLVISTISFSDPSEPLWVNQGDIEAMVGSEIYMFNEKMQFFAPYAACLVVTAAIYILGLWSLYKNGVSASNSFLQFVTTTSTSDTLHQVAETCSFGGAENMSQDLKDLRLRFAARGRTESDEEAGGEDSQLLVAGFVTENKVEYR